MKKSLWFTIFLLSVLALNSSPTMGQNSQREDFTDLDEWEPVIFSRIDKHSEYGVRQTEDGSVLVARSDASASGIGWVKEFNVNKYPVVRWRWKVTSVYQAGSVEKKSGDDYPLRVSIIFKYGPEQDSLKDRLTYGLAKLKDGAYPPHSSLHYIWANRNHDEQVYTSLYLDQVKMIILQSGMDKAGEWQVEEVNVVDDYVRVFGTKPPPIASIVVMNDSDDTGEASTSYIDYIEVLGNE